MSEPVWTPANLAIADIKDIALMPDGDTLLVLSDKSVVHVDLDTFLQAGSYPSPLFGSSSFLRQIGVANNGIAFVAPGINGFGASFVYKYNTRKHTFATSAGASVSQGAVGVSGDGSIILIGSRESNTSFNSIYQYSAVDDGQLITLSMNETANALPMDRTGNTVVLGMQNSLNDQRRVYQNEALLGAIPGSNANNINFSSALSADGARLYSYNPQSDVLNIYDLSSADGVGGFNQAAGSPVTVTDSAGTDLALTIGMTPFGGTLFIAGSAGVVVQPLP
jgi:hypothetical protein